MTPEQFSIFRAMMIQSIDQHLASGGTLITGYFSQENNCKCPISCMSVETEELGYDKALTNKLGFLVSSEDMWGFINGFDNNSHYEGSKELYQLGQEIRQLYQDEIKIGL